MAVLSDWVSPVNGSCIFFNRRLEILVPDMMFDKISTAQSPVCLCLIAAGLVFMNGKRLHRWFWESCIKTDGSSSYIDITDLRTRIQDSVKHSAFWQSDEILYHASITLFIFVRVYVHIRNILRFQDCIYVSNYKYLGSRIMKINESFS